MDLMESTLEYSMVAARYFLADIRNRKENHDVGGLDMINDLYDYGIRNLEDLNKYQTKLLDIYADLYEKFVEQQSQKVELSSPTLNGVLGQIYQDLKKKKEPASDEEITIAVTTPDDGFKKKLLHKLVFRPPKPPTYNDKTKHWIYIKNDKTESKFPATFFCLP